MTKTAEVDKLKEERERIRLASKASQDPTTNSYTGLQEKQMEVCEICGSFLIVGDAQVIIVSLFRDCNQHVSHSGPR